MPDAMIRVGTTDLFTSALYDNDATIWPNDGMLLDEWIGLEQLWLNDSGLVIDHCVDGRSSASFTVLDSTGAYTFYERQLVLIRNWDGSLRFAGIVHSCESITIPTTSIKFHSIDATDFTAILDWRIIDYAAENTLAGTAVRAILATYLAEEGITEGYIEDGYVLTEISIGNKSATDALTKLAEACGFVFYLDYDMKLYFHRRSLYAADWSISDGDDIRCESFQVVRANENYRNSETIIGGSEETSQQTENFLGNGVTKTFPVGYPVNRVVSVTVAGTAKTVGTKGEDTGYEVYYAKDSETITFDSGIAAPANGAAVVVVYYGLWVSKTVQYDSSAIVANAARQGVGSGKVEHITVDQNLTSIAAAAEYANAKLTEYAVDGIRVSYKTRREGLAAGVMQAIAYQGVDEDFLITHITEIIKDCDTEFGVEGVYGPISEEWDLFLNSSYTPIYAIREGVEAGGVRNVYNFSHEYENADRPNIFTKAYPASGSPLLLNDATLLENDAQVYTWAFIYEGGVLTQVESDNWPSFDPTDRVEYIELWAGGVCLLRKQHTSVVGEESDIDINSYTYIAPAEALGVITTVSFWGGDSATAEVGSGVKIYEAAFSYTKSALLSLQLNMEYLAGA